MSKERTPEEQKIRVSAAERGVALVFAGVVLITFVILVLSPRAMDGGTLAIVRFLAATFAGVAGYLFVGNLGLEASIPLNKVQVRATGGFATFVLVLLLFFFGLPSPNNSNGGEKTSTQQLEWVTYKPIPDLSRRISLFKLPTGERNFSLRFIAESWKIDFDFSVDQSLELATVKRALVEQFDLEGHIEFNLSSFPAPPRCYWFSLWSLTANGRVLDKPLPFGGSSGRPSLESAGVSDNDLLGLRVEWSTSCAISGGFDGGEASPPVKKPPGFDI